MIEIIKMEIIETTYIIHPLVDMLITSAILIKLLLYVLRSEDLKPELSS